MPTMKNEETECNPLGKDNSFCNIACVCSGIFIFCVDAFFREKRLFCHAFLWDFFVSASSLVLIGMCSKHLLLLLGRKKATWASQSLSIPKKKQKGDKWNFSQFFAPSKLVSSEKGSVSSLVHGPLLKTSGLFPFDRITHTAQYVTRSVLSLSHYCLLLFLFSSGKKCFK